MKKLFFSLLAILILFFSSCQKEEIVAPIDTEAIRAKVAALPAMPKEEVQKRLAGELKSAQIDENVIVDFFSMDNREIIVTVDKAVKPSVYWVTDFNGYRVAEITITQTFPIINGKVDTSSFGFSWEFGITKAKIFVFPINIENISDLTCHLRFKDGKQFYYNLESFSGEIALPPIEGANWQISGTTGNNNFRQEFMTSEINYYDNSNILNPVVQWKNPNVKCFVKFNKEWIKGANYIVLRGMNNNGGDLYLDRKVLYTDQLPECISFGAPFSIESLTICGRSGCQVFYTKDAKSVTVTIPEGIVTYQF